MQATLCCVLWATGLGLPLRSCREKKKQGKMEDGKVKFGEWAGWCEDHRVKQDEVSDIPLLSSLKVLWVLFMKAKSSLHLSPDCTHIYVQNIRCWFTPKRTCANLRLRRLVC